MLAASTPTEVAIIVDLLASVEAGETITYGCISDAIGRDISLCRYLLVKAMDIIWSEHKVLFENKRKVGYRRLPADEADIKTVGTSRHKVRKVSKRTVNVLGALASSNEISDERRRKILTEQSRFGLLEHIAKERNFPTVSRKDTKPLPVAIAAREFLKAIGGLPEDNE